jgi:hypothetical protein
MSQGGCHFGGISSKMKGMKEADSVLVAVYGKAGAADSYDGLFYPGWPCRKMRSNLGIVGYWDKAGGYGNGRPAE